jgi:hypothetical protein
MPPKLEDRVLDLGLNVLDTESTAIYIVSSATEPTTYALATSGAGSLGYKSFGAGAVFGSPAAVGTTGRSVSSAQVTDGTIVTSGTAAWWAIVAAASTLHAHGSLSANQVVAAGNTFTLAAFDIVVRNGA